MTGAAPPPERDGTLVLPNLGGDDPEGRSGDALPGGARIAARLFASLFPASARIRCHPRRPPAPRPWPEALGPPREEAVFPWLDRPGEAVAWIRTPEAERAAEGRRLLGSPPELTRSIHDKAFAHRLAAELGLVPPSLRGVGLVLDPALCLDPEQARRRIEEHLASWPEPLRRNFVLKPRQGGSARGRYPGHHGRTDAPDLAPALARLAARGGAVLEPWLERECDFSAQMLVEPDGTLRLLGTLEILAAPSGRTLGHRGTVDTRGRIASGLAEDAALREAAAAAGSAARDAGYRGPLGIDGFRFRAPAGGSEIRPLVELNARFTVGMIVIGLVRRALRSARRALRARPEELMRFTFALETAPGGLPPGVGAGALLFRLGCGAAGDPEPVLAVEPAAEPPGAPRGPATASRRGAGAEETG